MKLFMIVCVLVIVGLTAYTYKVVRDIAEHMEDTLVRHDIELARVHYRIDVVEYVMQHEGEEIGGIDDDS